MGRSILVIVASALLVSKEILMFKMDVQVHILQHMHAFDYAIRIGIFEKSGVVSIEFNCMPFVDINECIVET
jgi:hypothetical protein